MDNKKILSMFLTSLIFIFYFFIIGFISYVKNKEDLSFSKYLDKYCQELSAGGFVIGLFAFILFFYGS